ncbi:MAG: phosphatidylglycerophosphatase A [Thermotogota bacterium]|nr:phosphatidylglycerophosphatase A [Thermotogota bacterium]
MKNKLSLVVSTFFGIGYFPKAPGTAGSLVAFSIYLLLPENLFLRQAIYTLPMLLLLSIISVYFISKAEKILGHDSGKIVLDEVLGYFFSVILLPKKLIVIILSIVLFRIFDIFKPEPVNALQMLPKGWGVMADDIMAGIYANISIRIIIYLKEILCGF